VYQAFQQAQSLTNSMTLREKLGQITQTVAGYRCYQKNGQQFTWAPEFTKTVEYYGGIGAISGLLRSDPWTKRGYGNGIEMEQRVEMANRLQTYLKQNTRLGIPALIQIEASHGMQSLGSVMYPLGICSAASFQPELYQSMMQLVGQEIRQSGNHIAFVTMIDLARDPRWGRSEECFGEDPYLAYTFAKNGTTGLRQGGALVCAKHFCAAGCTEGGINSADIHIGPRELHEIHLPSAKGAFEAGAEFVMVAYNPIDGILCHTNRHLLQTVLRKELGFHGVVISDGCGVSSISHNLRCSYESAAVAALNAGIELSLEDQGAFATLEQTVQQKPELVEKINAACTHLLEAKFECGLMQQPLTQSFTAEQLSALQTKRNQKAYEMAAQSAVLLKNNNNLLPLSNQTKLCLIGENADSVYYLLGDYTSERKPQEGASLRRAFGERFKNLTFATGWRFNGQNKGESEEALKAAAQADVICLCLGGSSVRDFEAVYAKNGAIESSTNFMDCGEGCDVADLNLPPQQLNLLSRLKALGKPIVALLIQGRAYAISQVAEQADAIVVGWYPGQQGGYALADVLTGAVNPSGKLPVSIPASGSALPVCYDLSTANRGYTNLKNKALYPFGFGLSYTQFSYQKPELVLENDVVTATVLVQNSGALAGSEVVQLYAQVHGDGALHGRRLVGYQKVQLQPSQAQTVTFTVPVKALNLLPQADPAFDPVLVEFFTGGGSNCSLSGSVTITR